ncbi:energy-coupling factor transporter transmembrane component T family protein [Haloterrigena salifodinae]|uniref:energy-coupling factor transporter transmembrane component T family protein n=1 Tax=Haloterrigena salifodinae TaxID=2675099 RepID=UPI000F8713BF|nr:energy-coupling factor transporter transmembrane component T [Haloterrigena salifodinae]
MTYLDSLREGTSIDSIKTDLLRTAYDNDAAFLNRIDPRVLFAWYAVFLVVPWLFFDLMILSGLLAFVSIIAAVSRVSKFLIATLAFGTVTNLALYAVIAGLLGDGAGAVVALLPYTFKLTIISVASLAVFSSMSPKDISRGLLSLGVPRQFTFVIAYGYRMLPVLLQEYHDVVNSLRLRSCAPESPGFWRCRHYLYLLRLSVRAFYPMIFNVAKRSRVTVEAMESRGFSQSLQGSASRELQLEELRVRPFDVAFLVGSLAVVVAIAVLGS